ncbi:MAG TPA: outer membrane beta-barrel protein [Prolixibacteraceae bacterium]|nr:outer membrane beta-barrel protein [Prolixibacteraceae bacterium]
MKKDKNLDELFRDKLRNYEQAPPAYLLENVLAGVANDRRKRKIVFWRIAGVAAALLLAFVAGWQFNDLNTQAVDQPFIVNQSHTPEAKTEITDNDLTDSASAQNDIQEIPAAEKSTVNFESNKPVLVASQMRIQETKTSQDKTENVKADDLPRMKPMKILTQAIAHKTETANLLQDQNLKTIVSEQAEKTIDQQIMEQNQRIILAENSDKSKARWLVGAQVSPAYNVSHSSHTQVYASNMLNSGSGNPVDLGGGVSVEYKKGKRWSLQSGVYYSGIGQNSGNSSRSKGQYDMAASPARGAEYLNTNVSVDARTSNLMMNSTAGVIEFSDVPSGIVLGTNLEDNSLMSAVVVSDASFVQNFEYIEIPLYLRYRLLDSKFGIELMGGFSSNFLVGNQTYMESSDGNSLAGKTKDMESMNYSGTLGFGFKYGLSKRIYLNVEPRIKYFLNSLNSNSSVSYKPYTIGVFTGLSYEF